MMDMVCALLGLVAFIAFCGVLIAFVPQVDLIVVVVGVILMVVFDFGRELFWRRD